MNRELRYGGVALGVESALPALRLARPRIRARRLVIWLIAALKRWA